MFTILGSSPVYHFRFRKVCFLAPLVYHFRFRKVWLEDTRTWFAKCIKGLWKYNSMFTILGSSPVYHFRFRKVCCLSICFFLSALPCLFVCMSVCLPVLFFHFYFAYKCFYFYLSGPAKTSIGNKFQGLLSLSIVPPFLFARHMSGWPDWSLSPAVLLPVLSLVSCRPCGIRQSEGRAGG